MENSARFKNLVAYSYLTGVGEALVKARSINPEELEHHIEDAKSLRRIFADKSRSDGFENPYTIVDDAKRVAMDALPSYITNSNNFNEKVCIKIGKNLLPKKFTLKEIKTFYEAMSGKKLNPTNFPNKLIALGLIKKTSTKKHIGPHRAPTFYTFDDKKYQRALLDGLVLV